MCRSTKAPAALMLALFLFTSPAFAAQGQNQTHDLTLWTIAQRYGTASALVAALNNFEADQGAKPAKHQNEEIIPANNQARVYVVKRGDTLWGIALRYGTTVDAVKNYNQLAKDLIFPGQPLRMPPPAQTPGDEDLYWLAKVISAEARGEPLLGQVAVGAVVLNRVRNEEFPKSVREVVFQSRQFSVVEDGSIYASPTPSSYTAARLAFRGCDPTNGSLYFYNPTIVSRSNWIRSREVVKAIGRHLFAN